MITTFQDYSHRAVADGKIIFIIFQQKRMISLKDWVNDKVRLQKEVEFETGTNWAKLIKSIEESPERKECGINQKNTGESLITTAFQVKLETATQWDRWVNEFYSNLKMIIDAREIALSYVIRKDDDPNLEDQETWEYKAMLAAPREWNTYLQDKLTIHNIILRNITDGSNAFTYVKPYLRKDVGRLDIQDLRGQYENSAMQKHYINKSKRTLETFTYRNEWALKFEKFVAKFVKAVDELDKRNRGLYNADVVHMIWEKVTNPELNQYVVSLKVNSNVNLGTFKKSFNTSPVKSQCCLSTPSEKHQKSAELLMTTQDLTNAQNQ